MKVRKQIPCLIISPCAYSVYHLLCSLSAMTIQTYVYCLCYQQSSLMIHNEQTNCSKSSKFTNHCCLFTELEKRFLMKISFAPNILVITERKRLNTKVAKTSTLNYTVVQHNSLNLFCSSFSGKVVLYQCELGICIEFSGSISLFLLIPHISCTRLPYT